MSEGVKDPLERKVCVHSDSHVAARTGNLNAELELSAKTSLTENPALITLLAYYLALSLLPRQALQ